MASTLSEYSEFIALWATLLFLIQMMTPLHTFYRVVQTKTVGDLSVAPYNTAYLSCGVWMLYGIIINDVYVTNTNVYGALVQLGFTICYYTYAAPVNKMYVLKQILITSVVFMATAFYCYVETDKVLVKHNMEIFCSFITCLFFAAPFSAMKVVLKEKNAESLPCVLIMFTFVVSFLWMLYGVAIDDFALKLTNFLGVVMSSIQLFLIAIYRNPSKTKREPLLGL